MEEIVIETNQVSENVVVETKKIVVHITGCVVEEGIVTLPEGARMADAIKMARGTYIRC